MLLHQHFGISAQTLVDKKIYNEKRALRRWKLLRRNGNLVDHDTEHLKKLLLIMSRASENEKRNEKELKLLEPIIGELKFFK